MSYTALTKKSLLCGAAALAIVSATAGPGAAQGPSMWSGPYIGADFGYGAMRSSGRFQPSEEPGDPWSHDSGLVGGIHAGYDMDMGGFLVGVEADLMLTNFDAIGCSACVDGSESAVARIDWLASLRARAGATMGNSAVVYVTGGVAYRDAQWNASASGLDGKDSLRDFGGVIGAGAEFAVTSNVSARIEGLYYIFPEGKAPPDCCNPVGSKIRANPIVGRVGLSVRF